MPATTPYPFSCRTTTYVAKGGRRQPGPISRLASHQGAMLALVGQPSRRLPGGKTVKGQPRRSGPAPPLKRRSLPISSTDPPRGGAKCGTFGANAMVWCHQGWLPPPSRPPPATRPPPLHPPTQDMCMTMSVPVPVGPGRVGLGQGQQGGRAEGVWVAGHLNGPPKVFPTTGHALFRPDDPPPPPWGWGGGLGSDLNHRPFRGLS